MAKRSDPFSFDWEEGSRLSDAQHALVTQISELTGDPPLPDHVTDSRDPDNKDVPFSPLKMTMSAGGGSGAQPAEAVGDFETIEDMQQFYQWFDALRSAHSKGDEEPFVNHLAVIQGHQDLCDGIIREMDAALATLDRLEEQYGSVAEKSGQLHHACEELVAHQERLIEFSDTLAAAMDHFNQLDIIASQLSSPSCSVLDASFFNLLTRLDECLEFLSSNSTFKESATYMTKFKHLQSRALTMVKTYIISSLRSTANQLQSNRTAANGARPDAAKPKEGGGGDVRGDADVSVANVKFRALALKVRPLCEAIEKRAAHNASYKGLLADCHACYVQQRKLLISPAVSASTAAIIASTDIRTALRTGCNFLLRTCVNEHQLFSEFFEPSISAMRGLLEAFAGEVYQTFRPMFIRNRDYVVLCACIELLQNEVLDDKLTTSMNAIQWVQGTVKRMIGDIQERVAFLGQIYIQDAIINYVPSPDVLDYPDVLPPVGSGKHSPDTWYPVVQNTLRFLSHLYQSIDSKIFEDLAQEAVSECSLAVGKAAEAIKSTKGDVHSQLFFVRHLMLLREQISPFEIEFCVEERNLDFSRMKGAFRTFVEGISGSGFTSLFSLSRSNSLLSLMGSTPPRVQSKRVDSKKALDQAFKDALSCLLDLTVKPIFEDIASFLTVARAFVSVQQQHARQAHKTRSQGAGENSEGDASAGASNDEPSDGDAAAAASAKTLASQSFAEPAKLHDIFEETMQRARKGLPEIAALVRRYMPHASGVVRVTDKILEYGQSRMGEFSSLVRAHFSPEQQRDIGVSTEDDLRATLQQMMTAQHSPPPVSAASPSRGPDVAASTTATSGGAAEASRAPASPAAEHGAPAHIPPVHATPPQ